MENLVAQASRLCMIKVRSAHPEEKTMELYVPNFQLKEVSEVLTGEGVTFEVTDKTFPSRSPGKKLMKSLR
jgi:hypothetical protein